jgi:hypothetical protein
MHMDEARFPCWWGQGIFCVPMFAASLHTHTRHTPPSFLCRVVAPQKLRVLRHPLPCASCLALPCCACWPCVGSHVADGPALHGSLALDGESSGPGSGRASVDHGFPHPASVGREGGPWEALQGGADAARTIFFCPPWHRGAPWVRGKAVAVREAGDCRCGSAHCVCAPTGVGSWTFF